MESEYYDIAYVGSDKMFVVGYKQDGEVIVELNEAQRELVYDFNARAEKHRREFLKGFCHGE
jgi:hypothetical protein